MMNDKAAEDHKISYPGGELVLFEQAVNWKIYSCGHIRPYLDRKVLEAGAGRAGCTPYLLSDRVSEWTCLEPDPDNISEIRSKLQEGRLPPLCRAVAGTTENFTEAEIFDSIVYIDVLEHIEDDRGELVRASSLLRPNGILAVLAPAHQGLFASFDKAIGHYRRYDFGSLQEIVPPGLSLQRFIYLDSAGYWAYRAFGRFRRQEYPSRLEVKIWDNLIVPLSRLTDAASSYRYGKSIIGIWKKR